MSAPSLPCLQRGTNGGNGDGRAGNRRRTGEIWSRASERVAKALPPKIEEGDARGVEATATFTTGERRAWRGWESVSCNCSDSIKRLPFFPPSSSLRGWIRAERFSIPNFEAAKNSSGVFGCVAGSGAAVTPRHVKTTPRPSASPELYRAMLPPDVSRCGRHRTSERAHSLALCCSKLQISTWEGRERRYFLQLNEYLVELFGLSR